MEIILVSVGVIIVGLLAAVVGGLFAMYASRME